MKDPNTNKDISSDKWKNPPTIEQLKYDIEQAMTTHNEHLSNLDKWSNLINGRLTKDIEKGRSKIQPKVVRKYGEWRYPSLENPFLSSPDLFDVNPATHLDVEAARQNALILNKQFSVDINRVSFINSYVRAAVNTGTVIVKVSWEEKVGVVDEIKEVPVYAKDETERTTFIYNQVQQGVLTEPLARQLLASGKNVVVGSEKVLEKVEKVIVNRPVLEVKDSALIIIDPTCRGDINKANFIVDVFTTDLSTLKQDGRYKNLDKINIDEYDILADDIDMQLIQVDTFQYDDNARKKIIVKEYWGYWDINNTGTVEPIIASFVGDVLIRLEKNSYPDGKLPFVIVKYLPSPDLYSVYGDPDAALLEDNQEVTGAITRGIIDLASRTANAQKGIARGLLDSANMQRFKSGQDFVYNPIPGGFDYNCIQTTFPEVPRGAVELLAMQSKEAESQTGVIPFASNGINSQSLGASATGIKSALDATAKREASILQRLSQGLIEIGKKIISLNSILLTDEEIIRITDEEFVTISRATLAGSFDLRITISTAEEDNAKAQELAFMLQTIGNNTSFDIVKLILVEIANLRKLPGLAQAVKDYQPQPDPMQQEINRLQVELLKAQIREIEVKSDENMVDMELKGYKAEVERARARSLNSDSDRKDLDFMEQLTGLNQERELERIKMKSKGTQGPKETLNNLKANNKK